MTPDEIKGAVSPTIDAAVLTIKTDLGAKITAAETKSLELETKLAKVISDEADVRKEFIAYKTEMGKKKPQNENKSFSGSFAESVEKSFDMIQKFARGESSKASFEMDKKVAANMTAAADLTGGVITTYQPGMQIFPSPKVNFRDMVQAVPSATGSYTIYQENTGAQGAIAAQTAHGALKAQVDYRYKATVFTADYISGYVRIAKQMLQDLPFLQSYLPQQLMRDFLLAESGIFNTALAAVANTAAAGSALPYVERLINEVANLESANYAPTAIVLHPKDYAAIMKYKASGSGQYTYPGNLMVTEGGVIMLNGLPIYKGTFLAQNKFWVGDWSYAKNIVADGLKVEFFEQDSDNVERNLITVRIEAREVLGIDLAPAFTYGDFTV